MIPPVKGCGACFVRALVRGSALLTWRVRKVKEFKIGVCYIYVTFIYVYIRIHVHKTFKMLIKIFLGYNR